MNLRVMQGLNPAPRHRTWQSMMKKNFRLHCTLGTSSARSTRRVQARKGTARAIIWGCSNILAETARKRRDGDGEFLLAKLTWAHVWKRYNPADHTQTRHKSKTHSMRRQRLSWIYPNAGPIRFELTTNCNSAPSSLEGRFLEGIDSDM